MPMLPSITPYKIDIQQGNYVTQDMVAKLKPGMTRAQVRFILGTPLVVDPFRSDRWDYVYLFKKGGGEVEQRRIAVIFENDKLKYVTGDVTGSQPGTEARAGTGSNPGSSTLQGAAETSAAPPSESKPQEAAKSR